MPRRRLRRRYPANLTDGQWSAIAELVPDASPGGRPRSATSRELVNAIFYMLRGCEVWRLLLLPYNFLPWKIVYYYPRRWQDGDVAAQHTLERRSPAQKSAPASAEPRLHPNSATSPVAATPHHAHHV